MTAAPLALVKVGKIYGGRRVLADVNVTFQPGRIAAVLGPNGAGKTTLLGILSTLVTPSAGEVRWGGEVLERGSPARARIGYVGHEPGIYGDLTAAENVALFASACTAFPMVPAVRPRCWPGSGWATRSPRRRPARFRAG